MNKIGIVTLLLVAVYIGYQFVDPFDPDSVKGKNVIITGASTGIGEQLAYQYARLGANIVITARREHRLKEVVDKCKKEGRYDGQYHYIPLDMANKNSTKMLIEFAEKSLGGIDALVLNHVVYIWENWHGTPKDMRRLYYSMDVNFFAYVSAANHAAPALEKSKGSIIVLNSWFGKIPAPSCAPYNGAKHALEGFFGSLREEFVMSNTNISITMATLGFIETENVINYLKARGVLDKILKLYASYNPSNAALTIIKGGAQKLDRIHYPAIQTRPFLFVYNLMPEVTSFVVRYLFEPTA